MTFEQFKVKCDHWIAEVANGMTSDDFADAPWYDLYEDLGEDIEKEDVLETLAEADDIFAAMLDAQGIWY